MTPETIGLVFMGALLTGIFVGFPICFTLIILSVVFGFRSFISWSSRPSV
jgi:TRAP-type mannitol/chloroaromatic compound transport system permease large subunit